MNDPIRSNNAVGDVRTLWDAPQKQWLPHQTLRLDSGKMLSYTMLYYIPEMTT